MRRRQGQPRKQNKTRRGTKVRQNREERRREKGKGDGRLMGWVQGEGPFHHCDQVDLLGGDGRWRHSLQPVRTSLDDMIEKT
jgi:hypothetical protein